MFTALQILILDRICRVSLTASVCRQEQVCARVGKVLGEDFFRQIAGKVVLDFGCGEGADSVEMATNGARRVIGLDIREEVLERARHRAVEAGVGDRCVFTTSVSEAVDIVVSIDGFEHFSDPAGALNVMRTLLVPQGEVFISFGPTWYHPSGSHLPVLPWAHLVFSERALMTWRSSFRSDGATRFSEVSGGLNQMTIARFEKLLSASGLQVVDFWLVPIGRLRWVHSRLTREFTTAAVCCRLVRRAI